MAICSICQRANRSAIDAALLQGDSVRSVAAQFGLTKSAVARHRSGHLAVIASAAARLVAPAAEINADVNRARAVLAGEMPTGATALGLHDLLGRIETSLSRLENAAVSAANEGLFLPLSSLSGQLHKAIQIAGQLQNIGGANNPSAAPGGFHIVFQLPGNDGSTSAPRNVTPIAGEVSDAEPFALTMSFAEPG